MCTSICFEKPENIQDYLREQLKMKQQHGFKTGIFKKEEIINIFTLFDLKKNGTISRETCK
jgi:Ca2+-binding EF-hand superfamily protein